MSMWSKVKTQNGAAGCRRFPPNPSIFQPAHMWELCHLASGMTEDSTLHRSIMAFQRQGEFPCGRPDLGGAVLPSGQNIAALGGEAHGVDGPQMVPQHVKATATVEVPDLGRAVPAGRGQSATG